MVNSIPDIERVDEYFDGCAIEKQHRLSFLQATSYRAQNALDLVHINLCGPITPTTPIGNKYFLCIVDYHSRFMWLELFKSKDEAFKCFKIFKTAVEVKGRCKLRAFSSDQGGEFNSNEFRNYCHELGIKKSSTAPYSP